MTQKTEESIKRDIIESFSWDSRIDPAAVEAEVASDGTVTLSGTVPAYRSVQAAEEDAWGVRGVSAVVNNLAVAFPGSDRLLTDEQIRSNLEQALQWNPVIDAHNIRLSVREGVADMQGSVSTYWAKIRAEETAREIAGILNVVNRLTVVPTEDYDDRRIAERVADALDRDSYISSDAVDVNVENGTVTLTGSVPGWGIYTRISDALSSIQGIVHVSNELRIEETR
jgi:osmotically-inducible protein OsmY